MSISTQNTWLRVPNRVAETELPCASGNCDGEIVRRGLDYVCDECGVHFRYSTVADGEHIRYERYDNSGRWRMIGAYNPHGWDGSYSLGELSQEDALLSDR